MTSTHSDPVLVTGATGHIGRQVVQQLLARGSSVRTLSRKPSTAAPPDVQAFIGDLSEGAVPAAALDGVRRVFLFPAEKGVEAFLRSLRGTSVEHVVLLSSLAAALEHERDAGSMSAVHHLEVERQVAASGLAATVLRPGTFATNLLAWARPIRLGSAVEAPFPTSAQAPIHEADVAAVAVEALTRDGHRGATYALTGPQVLTRVQQLDAISAALGRPLAFHEISGEAFAAAMGRFMPAPLVQMLLRGWAETALVPDRVRPTVAEVTGSPGRTLSQWALDHAADFR